MVKFLIDEDMPRSTGNTLKDNGYETVDVRDCGLRGKTDREIFEYAIKENLVILTGDLGFGNIIKFPMGRHWGIVIIHFPNDTPVQLLNEQIISCFKTFTENDFHKNLIIVEPQKVRIRKKLS
jgi:predicted nuclease of predicted toxin-antitoxin system